MHIKANGINFWCEIDGAQDLPADKPWLIFSNSLTTNLAMWVKQAAYFSDRYRVLRYDQRGHGQSDAPPGAYTFDLLIADALALMDAFAIARASFCGLSLGGATAFGMAQRHADRLDRVIVADSGCGSRPALSGELKERIATVKAEGLAVMVEPTIARWFPEAIRAANPPYLNEIRRMIANTSINGFVGCSEALADYDFWSKAKTVKLPVLFVVGGKDGTVPNSMRTLHVETPDSKFVELPGAGHISNLDQADLFNRAVEEFLKQ